MKTKEDLFIKLEDSCLPCSPSPYQDFASAIVEQAAMDYITVLQKMWNKDLSLLKKRALLSERTDLERFFHSEWFETLTNLNPDLLIKGCRQSALEKQKALIRHQNKMRVKAMMNANEIEGGKTL